jgi:hypothetical protein
MREMARIKSRPGQHGRCADEVAPVRNGRFSELRVQSDMPQRAYLEANRTVPAGTSTRQGSEQAIDSKGIPNAKDIGRRVAIKAHTNVKIDLLCVGDAIAATGVEQLAVPAHRWEPAHILGKQKAAFAELSFDRERRLIRVSVH